MKKNILVGVCGGIAAYKICQVVSDLKKHNFEVYTVMTKNAVNFVSPLTFQTLSQNPVSIDMFDHMARNDVHHISLAEKAQIFLIAPATANIIGKLACGIADDLLTTTALAFRGQLIIAPAMNTRMYTHPAVVKNIEILKKRGAIFIEPTSGLLACGDVGIGKLADISDIVDAVLFYAQKTDEFKNKKIVITAGHTIEDLDPVRYLTNRSTGKMGYALAERAAVRGADVTLISGETQLKKPYGIKTFIHVRSAEDMYGAVKHEFEDADILIKAAAVADYTPKTVSHEKIKKSNGNMTIEMKRTSDILLKMGEIKKVGQIIVGFSAETENIEQNTLKKLKTKNADIMVSNDVSLKDAGFASDTNRVSLFFKDKPVKTISKMSKLDIADKILDNVLELIETK